jgi:DNA-nicking Smr family endonuclease
MRSLPEDEEFRRAVEDVAPLRPSRRAAREIPRRAPVAAQRRLVEDALETGEEFGFLRDGLSREILRKLRRGHWVVEDELDLHGMNRAEAALSVAEFVRRCSVRGARCVRIVHGKGFGSPNREPVLKRRMRDWLSRRDEVLAICPAPAAQGGGGAMLVLLAGAR